MKKKHAALLLCLTAALALSACSSGSSTPPDLTGHWVQPSENDWYHIATITEDKIQIWWYLPAEDNAQLYWSGSFTPPTDGSEPYVWKSTNDFSEEYLDLLFKYRRTSREPTKEFAYKDGKIVYTVKSGHLMISFALERSEGPDTPIGAEP